MTQNSSTSDLNAFREAALHCPLPHAVELLGEKWAFLILRGAFNGLQHFEEFQAGLGIARNILSDRLAKLVAGGILERSQDETDRRKVIYSLTAKGEALLPVVVALRQWGEEWGHGPARLARDWQITAVRLASEAARQAAGPHFQTMSRAMMRCSAGLTGFAE